jgi:hypothetical protein
MDKTILKEVLPMTEPVVCRNGHCRYKNKKMDDGCVDCDLEEQIEYDLVKGQVKKR